MGRRESAAGRTDVRASQRICATTTLRTTPEVTREFLSYHLNSGIDHVYVFLDDPSDPVGGELAGDPRLTVTPCDGAHWGRVGVDAGPGAPLEERQLANTNTALSWARESGFDWIVHLDGDELVNTRAPLRSVLGAAPDDADAVLMPLLEAVPSTAGHRRPFREITRFKAAGLRPNVWRRYRIDRPHGPQWRRYRRRLASARRLGARSIRGDGDYYRGAYMPRAFVRVDRPIERLLVKGPVMADGRVPRAVVTDRAELLHFVAPSYDDWLVKWRRRIDGTATASRSRRAVQEMEEEFRGVFGTGDEARLAALFAEWHLTGRWERLVLRAHGLLRRIRVDHRLFER